MNKFKIFLTSLCCLALAIPGFPVTDKEMEEARALTAKAYLRYVNNGSDYLDKLTPKSMADLNAKLKTKEKENIKAFNAVKTPTDYASWDKDRLVEYWSSDFFKAPGLDPEGLKARPRVKKYISEMSVSAPAPTPEPAPAPEPAAAPAADSIAQEAIPVDTTQQDILSDQKAIQEDAAEAAPLQEESGDTWIFVIVLIILVGVVIGLVVYASRLMRKNPEFENDGDEAPADEDMAALRARAREAIAAKDEEIATLQTRLQTEENKVADMSMEMERLKLNCSRLEQQIATLRKNNARLSTVDRSDSAPIPSAQPLSQPAARPARALEDEPVAPPRRSVAPTAPAKVLKVLYLGRANARGIFVRADRRITPGNTIYRLDTNDGLVGTFHVVDEPVVLDVALSSPDEYLAHGCVCDDFNDTEGVSRIITESEGTAIFENGYWKVLRKSTIRYE
ncbi:MAG: hypothetical protein ACI304_08305 [Lepagella sp.]